MIKSTSPSIYMLVFGISKLVYSHIPKYRITTYSFKQGYFNLQGGKFTLHCVCNNYPPLKQITLFSKKRFLITIVLFAGITNANAQTDYTPTGTWKYINGNDTLEVFFKTDSLTKPSGYSYPVVLGYQRYVKNGEVIYSDLQNINNPFLKRKCGIIIFNRYPTYTKMEGILRDLILKNDRDIGITKINPTTMVVGLYYLEGVRKDYSRGFTLPRHFTLIKQ